MHPCIETREPQPRCVGMASVGNHWRHGHGLRHPDCAGMDVGRPGDVYRLLERWAETTSEEVAVVKDALWNALHSVLEEFGVERVTLLVACASTKWTVENPTGRSGCFAPPHGSIAFRIPGTHVEAFMTPDNKVVQVDPGWGQQSPSRNTWDWFAVDMDTEPPTGVDDEYLDKKGRWKKDVTKRFKLSKSFRYGFHAPCVTRTQVRCGAAGKRARRNRRRRRHAVRADVAAMHTGRGRDGDSGDWSENDGNDPWVASCHTHASVKLHPLALRIRRGGQRSSHPAVRPGCHDIRSNRLLLSYCSQFKLPMRAVRSVVHYAPVAKPCMPGWTGDTLIFLHGQTQGVPT